MGTLPHGTSTGALCQSAITQNAVINLNSFVGVGLIQGTAAAALDVNGSANNSGISTSDNRKAYMIKDSSGVLHPVLSIFPFSNNNLFVGAGTGSGGSFNTFSGANAGSANVNGNYNTSSGANAGFANLNGGLNTFSGAYAGYYNKFSRNTFSGFGVRIRNVG